MNPVYLEFHQDSENKHRFYQMFVLPTLFDDWSLVREWGRIGSPGTIKKDWFETEEKAALAQSIISQQKIKKGYALAH